MQRDIEMIGAGSVDGAVALPAAEDRERERHSSAGEVAQDEAQCHPLPQRSRRRRSIQARDDSRVVQLDRRDDGEGDQRRTVILRTAYRHPVRPDVVDDGTQSALIRDLDHHDGAVGGDTTQTPAQFETGYAQPLGFGVEGGPLRLPFGGELILQVFEESLPLHEGERRARSDAMYELSTCVRRTAPCANGRMLYFTRMSDRSRAAPMTPHEYFAPQPTPASELPDPAPLLRSLTTGALEVLAGVREVEQLARWFSEDAYRSLVIRANLSARARSARGAAPTRPTFTILSLRHSAPAESVVEAVIVVAGPGRARAVAIRLEGLDRRWRATSLAIL